MQAEGDSRESLEREKLELENQKLRAELLKEQSPGLLEWMARLSPLLATCLAVLGFLFGVVQYVDQQRAERQAAADREVADAKASDREFMVPLWSKELDVYFKATNAVATIATTKDAAKRTAAEAEFWQLYEGPMIVVESKNLSDAMVAFGNCLDGTDRCDEQTLRHRAEVVGTKVQRTIESSAQTRLSAFSQGKFQYDEVKRPAPR